MWSNFLCEASRLWFCTLFRNSWACVSLYLFVRFAYWPKLSHLAPSKKCSSESLDLAVTVMNGTAIWGIGSRGIRPSWTSGAHRWSCSECRWASGRGAMTWTCCEAPDRSHRTESGTAWPTTLPQWFVNSMATYLSPFILMKIIFIT